MLYTPQFYLASRIVFVLVPYQKPFRSQNTQIIHLLCLLSLWIISRSRKTCSIVRYPMRLAPCPLALYFCVSCTTFVDVAPILHNKAVPIKIQTKLCMIIFAIARVTFLEDGCESAYIPTLRKFSFLKQHILQQMKLVNHYGVTPLNKLDIYPIIVLLFPL